MNNNAKKNPLAEEENYSEVVYFRLSDIPGYSPEALNKTFFYVKIENYLDSGKDVFIRTTEKQAHDYRNLNRNTERTEYSHNEHIGNRSVSIYKEVEGEDGETTVIEYEDKENTSPENYAFIREMSDRMMSYAADEYDIKIIECLLNGMTNDREIADTIGFSRSSTQARRAKLQYIFKTEMSDYEEGLRDFNRR